MRHRLSTYLRSAIDAVLIIAAFGVCLPASTFADKKSAAREQFERAVKMRTMLEGLLPRDRELDDYKQTIDAFQKVYLVSTQAEEVTPSLIAEAELYCEMGRLYEPKYFQSAINMYKFLLQQYPETRYRGEALLAIAEIQKNDQNNFDAAEATFKDFLKRYPKNDRAEEARAALAEIAEAREKPSEQGQRAVAVAKNGRANTPESGASNVLDKSAASRAAEASSSAPRGLTARTVDATELGPVIEPRESDRRWTNVKSIEASSTNEHTRIIVALDDPVKYRAVHLHSPDRIYFDLHKARVGPKISSKSIDFQNGLVKSVRVGQNRPDVVRLVLDPNGARNYTAVLVGKPYRLVIDLRRDVPARSDTASSGAPGTSGFKESAEKTTAAETVSVNADKPAAASDSASALPPKAEKTAINNGKLASAKSAVLKPAEAQPTRDGQPSLTRTLGLKIGRIVIDAGHGGHDTGTIGPHGLMEKDLCLDVALRLGHIIEEKLPGAEVIYTRKDDTFIPLEQRTAIANEAKADLFISIHANSSRDHDTRGVETYYLNFATSPESMEVATRENAYSEKSLHDLQDLVQKIARNEKIEESKELASDIQDALSHRLQLVSSSEHNRGVKRAPFVVLIGANMPSVLSEISFVSNPSDERMLRRPEQRETIALGLYRGVSTYLESLNSLSYNKQKLASDAPTGNPTATTVVPAVNQR
jgi:N-acetylmuramoyl-L-alanine amidase